MTTTQRTKVSRGWFFKRFLIPLIVLLGMGVWGLFDAIVVYPHSGRLDASKKLKEYLQTTDEARRLTPSFVQVKDPGAEYAALAAREKATGSDQLSPAERLRLDWLRAMKMMWELDSPEVWVCEVKRPMVNKTGDQVFAGVGGVSDVKQEVVQLYYHPREAEGVLVASDGARETIPLDAVLRHLKDYWTTARTPSALAFYDLALQWFFVFIGLGGGLYLLVLYARVSLRKYSFDPETHTLTLPNKVAIAPADIKEFDKRKWHKFFVALHLHDGRTFRFDLMRYDFIEDWILAMEKVAFPEASVEEDTDTELGDDALAPAADTGKVRAMTYGGLKDGVFAVFLFDPRQAEKIDRHPPAYAEGEVLKAMGVALRDHGAWTHWLTVASGTLKQPAAPGAGAQSELADLLTERAPTSKADVSGVAPEVMDAFRGRRALDFDPLVIIIGRLDNEVASRAHESLGDPPAAGYLGMATVRVSPPTIETLAGPLGLEPGMEIKGTALVGRWESSPEDVKEAGLTPSGGGAEAA